MESRNSAQCKTNSANTNSRANGSRLGRPSKAESIKRHEELLECALDIFMDRGFEQTTVAHIANVVGMSKRTIYAYYDDKEQLFKAAVKRATDRYTIPIEALEAIETDDLEQTLEAVARMRIANLATPTGIKLQRILITQSYRFPELFNTAFEAGAGPTVTFLADLFVRKHKDGEVNVTQPRRAALAFMSLVVGGPARLITAGSQINEEEIEARIHFTTQLFLNGIRPR